MTTVTRISESAGGDPLSTLAAAMGSDNFSQVFMDRLGHWVLSQHFSLMRMDQPLPSMLMAGSCYHDRNLVWRCWRDYSHFGYQNHDPILTSVQRAGLRANRFYIGRACARDIRFRPYRQGIYENTGIEEKLSGLHRIDGGATVLFNLYRHGSEGSFSDRELSAFEALCPALMKILQGHLALREARDVLRGDDREKLRARFPELTGQELNVCVLIAQGMTYAGVAATLGIKESTVKTLRNRAFARMGINFRNQIHGFLR